MTPCSTDPKVGALDAALPQLLPDHESVSLGLVFLIVPACGRPLFSQMRQGPAKTRHCSCPHRRPIAPSTARMPVIKGLFFSYYSFHPLITWDIRETLSCWNPTELLTGPALKSTTFLCICLDGYQSQGSNSLASTPHVYMELGALLGKL